MDVKPENVRLHPVAASGAEHAVLLDWGYARRLGPQSEPIRQGTPLYAAPEQLTGYSTDGVSARATLSETVDVWGLGATLCEMCCGSPPFAGRDFEQLVGNVLQLNLVAAARVISGPPRELLDEMLQILPSDRATLDELYEHQWVADSGGLPTLDDVALLCEDCSDGPGGGAKRCAPPRRLRRARMARVAAPAAHALLYRARRRPAPLVPSQRRRRRRARPRRDVTHRSPPPAAPVGPAARRTGAERGRGRWWRLRRSTAGHGGGGTAARCSAQPRASPIARRCPVVVVPYRARADHVRTSSTPSRGAGVPDGARPRATAPRLCVQRRGAHVRHVASAWFSNFKFTSLLEVPTFPQLVINVAYAAALHTHALAPSRTPSI